MRYFPSAKRQHLVASVVAVVSLAALANPLAHADEDDRLKSKQREVQSQIDRAQDSLAEASRDAAKAQRAFVSAKQRLGAARRNLSAVTERLVAARERDAELQQQLEEAEAELAAANADLSDGKKAMRAQRAAARANVLSVFTQGDPRLRAINGWFESDSVSDLMRQRFGEQIVVDRNGDLWRHLADVKTQLALQKQRVKTATELVESKREDAAAQLTAMRKLYDQSRSAKLRVDDLVTSSKAAQVKAIRAKSRDRRLLAELEQREASIRQRLVELARQAALRAQRNGTGFTGDSDGFLSYPANGPVTSPYGYRIHPIYGYYGLHNGTDFGVPCGGALYAGAAGTVIDVYYDSVYGNRLYLNVGIVNGKNLVLVYNHATSYRVGEGARVGRGDVIGYAGSTGWSTGCHLHFTVLANGNPVDPMNYL
ncbi:peptidoglycan DD-metalloendopeptidase family protein [Nocardioides sp. R-C-SC26]|uniref:peptidoglycan DD-metalloendopeptidase family protein n=1 Tax=Nocardioides sp. R-C-SC26 TaxID=2870414 RepID=UPI001E45A0AB|nr:peptidoglycan DD-metalloendopeptidase family protein [Nocardioides sp. R-C-SC26]